MLKKPGFYKITLIVLFLLFIYKLADTGMYIKERDRTVSEIGLQQTIKVKQSVDSIFQYLISNTNEIAQLVSENSYNEDQLTKLVKDYSLKIDLCLGVTIAFEPYQFNKEIKLLARITINIRA